MYLLSTIFRFSEVWYFESNICFVLEFNFCCVGGCNQFLHTLETAIMKFYLVPLTLGPQFAIYSSAHLHLWFSSLSEVVSV